MQLRDYQQQIEQKIYKAWEHGAVNVGVELPTGSGKTVIFTKFLAEFPGDSIVVAHRMELVSQISLMLARRGIHHALIAQKPIIRAIISLHLAELGESFYDVSAKCRVAGVDTLLRGHPCSTAWMKRVGLIIQDEAHHVLRDNKWGKAASLFPNARGLYPTATPIRADGCGLGRHADGILDTLIMGPPMRQLIDEGYLTDYKIYVPPSDLDLSTVTVSASGDYSPPKLRTAVHKSHITGDVVSHYLRFAAGKLGVTFAVDIAAAIEIATAFKAAGVLAEVISSKTPDFLRYQIMRKFRNREILQLVNVDLLGEGVDVPAIEVISFARPTQSYALYSQQFGRALRPLEGKTHAIIIDHVGNVLRHGLPDRRRVWSLDRRERKSRTTEQLVPIRACLNPECLAVYERVQRVCPFCGHYPMPAARSAPEYVDGDLLELDNEALARLRGEIDRIDNAPRVPTQLNAIIQKSIINKHVDRQHKQHELRNNIALWAGQLKAQSCSDSEIYRRFYYTFGTDVLTAQTLNSKDAESLTLKIKEHFHE